mmetsp:Transcript_16608/g.48026  ORF Transcript_16608/g.48026 Transcript_16608/m.48026 type:complete len:211 (+) Transcript_16608:70-702(+)
MRATLRCVVAKAKLLAAGYEWTANDTISVISSSPFEAPPSRCACRSKRCRAHILNSAKLPKLSSITLSRACWSSAWAHCARAASNEANEAATSASVELVRARSGGESEWRGAAAAKGRTAIRSSGAPILRKVKSSMTHQSRLLYVGPAMTSSVSQPARKMGRHASASCTFRWSMQSLSSQTEGGRPCSASKASAHALSAAHFGSGGSCQL